MPIKLGFFSQKSEVRRKFFSWLLAPGFLLLTFKFLLFPCSARAEQAVLGVVQSEENTNQWIGITKGLQKAGVAYCVIPLPAVKSAVDLGDPTVVFLPNVETVTPAQAIALEEWMSRGGRVIASGPLGNLSQPGVRQMLQTLLGAYWGFSLSTPSNLQPQRIKTQEWLHQAGLAGTVQGGVVVPASLSSQAAAVWQSQNNAAAVVTTDRSTFFGWRWGVNAAAPVELDSAWLRAALSRHIQLSSAATTKVDEAESPKNCDGTVATDAIAHPAPPTPPAPQVAIAPKTSAITGAKPQQELDPIERLAAPGVAPNSSKPSAGLQAIALGQELENLIGRFESAQLAANARGGEGEQGTMGHGDTGTRGHGEISASPRLPLSASSLSPEAPQSSVLSPEKAIAQAREIAKALTGLIDQKNYVAARQQWLKAQQLLWNHYPTDRTLAQPEIRAMWLDRGSIVRAGSEQELAKIFDRLAQAGINTVFFETVNAGYPIYPSEVALQQNPFVQGWDPLASGVKLARERGMELHAWVWTFAVGNRRHNALVNLPANYPGPLIAAHPDWASFDNRGSLFPPGQGKPFLDPANRSARQYLLQLFDEIVSRYQVDGLQLDYIRYPFQDPSADRTYGYGRAARQQFQQLTGVDPINIRPRDRYLWQKWTEFRTQQIDTFVLEASRRLRQKRPNLILSVAVFPLSEHERLNKLQQHWEVWARRGDVDLVVPMTYALDTSGFQRLAQPWITSTDLGSTLILPGIRLLNLPVLAAFDQIQLVRDLAVSGYSLFAVDNLSNELQKVFHSTQGTSRNTLADPVPYRQPFQTAAVRYAALQREWNFLLESKQLMLHSSALSSFSNQAKDLERALNQLSSNPASSQLAVARASLTAFQSQFPGWMRLHALKNAYQVKVWQNRLATLERLLSYGERVELQREAPPVAEQR